jgi:uncharacterized phage-associated protein
MPAVSAHDVARELRRRLPSAGIVKIQKLLYYCQGWHVTRNGDALFTEPVEAWVNGPVVAKHWADEKHERPQPERRALSDSQLATVEYVVERYGRYPGQTLIRMSHLEDPWRSVSESDSPDVSGTAEISLDALRAWFSRDDDYIAHISEVERLRERRDVYSFAAPPVTAELRAAVARALADGDAPAHHP